MFLCQVMPAPFWLHLGGRVEIHKLEKQISKSLATALPLPKKPTKKRKLKQKNPTKKQKKKPKENPSQLNLSSTLVSTIQSWFLVDLKLTSLPCENARKEAGHRQPPPGIHTGTRRQQQGIFSQTPGKPAVRVSSRKPQSRSQQLPVADRFQFSRLSSVSQCLRQRPPFSFL